MSAIVAPRLKWMQRLAGESYTPSTDVPSLLAWYRADTVTTATGVSQLTDKTGNGYHFVQGTGVKQPALIASGSDPNGRDCVVADGTDDAMTIASPGFGAMNDITIIGVTRSMVAPGANGHIMSIGNAADARSVQITTATGLTRPNPRYNNPGSTISSRNVETSSDDTSWTLSTPKIWSVRHDSTAAASATPITRSRLEQPVTANGSSLATVSTLALQAVGLFGTKAGTGGYLSVGLYEMFVCNALLTDDQVRRAELYLAGYYGLL